LLLSVRLSACLSVCPSGAYIANNSRTKGIACPNLERRFPTDFHISFKVKRSKVRVTDGRGHTVSAEPGDHTACCVLDFTNAVRAEAIFMAPQPMLHERHCFPLSVAASLPSSVRFVVQCRAKYKVRLKTSPDNNCNFSELAEHFCQESGRQYSRASTSAVNNLRLRDQRHVVAVVYMTSDTLTLRSDVVVRR